MGWAWLALFGAGAFALLWRLGIARSLWSFAGAALMLGATGYALQGRPDLPARPARAQAMGAPPSAELTQMRSAMFGRFTYAEPYFAISDAMIRAGSKRSAVAALLGGINTAPDNFALWSALGSAYAEHDGAVSPPARLAFGRALSLAPEHPGPPFFLGVALLGDGKWSETRYWWSRAYRLSPPGTAYREQIAARLVMLDELIQRDQAAARPLGSTTPR